MRFCGEMNHRSGLGYQLVDDVRVRHIAVKETEMRVALEVAGNIVQITGVGQGIEQEDFVMRVVSVQLIDEITADKTRSTCDQQGLCRKTHLWGPLIIQYFLSRQLACPCFTRAAHGQNQFLEVPFSRGIG